MEALRSGTGAVWVSGATGSGRTTLLDALCDALDEGVRIELPSLAEADAGAALALGLIAAIPDVDARRRLVGLPLAARVPAAVAGLRESGRIAMLRVPASWGVDLGTRSDDRRQRARAHLTALGGLPVVWVVDAGVDPSWLGVAVQSRFALDMHSTGLPAGAWGAYETHAERLRAALHADVLASPIVWRLAVGATALGAAVEDVAAHCLQSTSRAITGLVRLLGEELRRDSHVRDAVRRFVQIRRPLPRERLVEVVRPPDGTDVLFTSCLAYGDPVRCSDAVRRRLLALFPRPAPRTLGPVHDRLAAAYASLDGVDDPAEVTDPWHMGYWLEKVHHLGHGGPESAEAWSRHAWPSPELYWDRARHLSVDLRDFEGAAAVYRACLERFPSDDYAAHYLGWNLHRAGRLPDCGRWYARAVELAPTNPWWNGRRISFLVESGDYLGAKRAWRDALSHLDPDGNRAQEDPWYVAHVHYWVARAWLDAGFYVEARAVIEGLTDDVIDRAATYRPRMTGLVREVRTRHARNLDAFDKWLERQESGTARRVREVWDTVRRGVPGIPPPAAVPLDGARAVQLAWSQPGWHVEIDVREDGWIEWFARDRLRDRFEGSDAPEPSVGEALLRWLRWMRHG